jgi:hypothetical protein
VTFYNGDKHFLALKVPRQCQLILLVEVHLRKRKLLAAKKLNTLECWLCYGPSREARQRLYCVWTQLILMWSSGKSSWLQSQRFWVQSTALPDFLRCVWNRFHSALWG